MATFIQFYNGEHEALGSDGCQPIDGRLSLMSAIMEGSRRARALRQVGKKYTALRVIEGDVPSRARPRTGIIPIEVQ